jgi:prophage maintenance system killer protein
MTGPGPAFTFLTVEDLLSLHDDAIDTWGGTHGIRDRGLLESAVGAATNVALYDEAADIHDVAAAYARRWPEPRRAVAEVLRRLSGAR